MLVNPLLPTFLDAFCRSMSYLRRKTLRIVYFLVLCSTCQRSFFDYFQNDLEYLKRGTAQMFIPFLRFLQQIFVVLLKYSILIFPLSLSV